MKELIYIFDESQIDRGRLLELLEGFDDDKPLTAGDLKYLIGQSPKNIHPVTNGVTSESKEPKQ